MACGWPRQAYLALAAPSSLSAAVAVPSWARVMGRPYTRLKAAGLPSASGTTKDTRAGAQWGQGMRVGSGVLVWPCVWTSKVKPHG